MNKIRRVTRLLVLALFVVSISLSLAGCKCPFRKDSSNDHPKAEHPKTEQSEKEHPETEHPE